MLPQLDLASFPSQIFWFFVCFGLLFCYVNFYFFPRMQKMFEKREAKINSENKIFEYNLKEIESIKQSHAQMILDAKKQSEEIIKNAEDGTNHFIETKKIEIDANFNKKFAEAKTALEKELVDFHQNIEEEILKSASQIIEKIENNNITLEDLKKLNDKS
jgi:F-type H+-transporting ATPase subunit b